MKPVLDSARQWLGTPYHHRASVKGVGCDCVGLLVGVYKDINPDFKVDMPPYSPDWGDATGAETLVSFLDKYCIRKPIDEMQAGDIIGFRWRQKGVVKHVAILSQVQPLRMIHAAQGAPVCEVSIPHSYQKRLAYAWSFPI